ncbi:MAG TPA: HAD family hydrolase [Saprospiraceae bacterium]|nr:HAD family hydrolase [Saprospiraceae bacterium]
MENWTLFLDRDGVINEQLPGDYVKTVDEFRFKQDFIDEIASLSSIFSRIFVVTNQQGIGKGIMTLDDLDHIHAFMLQAVNLHKGRLDRIYVCPHLKELDCDCRKPKPGMLLQAFAEFPDSRPERSILIGDTAADMQAARKAGVIPVGMLHQNNKDIIWDPQPKYLVDSLEIFRTKVLPLVLPERHD